MFPSSGNNLSFLKILGGISKSLNIAREIIPIYEQAKPMVQNARKAFYVLKEINLPKTESSHNVTTTKMQNDTKKAITQSNSPINNPSFFR